MAGAQQAPGLSTSTAKLPRIGGVGATPWPGGAAKRAAKSQREQKLKQKKIGFLVDHYLEEGPRAVRWMGGVRVLKHHRSMSSIINACIGAGLSIYLIDECHRMPMLSYEVLDSERVCVAHYNRRPLFLVLGAVKR